jgi:hypothetical protein
MKKLIIAAAFILLAGVAFGQTLKKGAVISISVYTITLEADVTMDQYIDFGMNKYLPALEKSFPGVKGFTMKGDRGKDANELGSIWLFESVELRDKYFNEGSPTELGASAMQEVAPVIEEFNKLGTQVREYTDWVIL